MTENRGIEKMLVEVEEKSRGVKERLRYLVKVQEEIFLRGGPDARVPGHSLITLLHDGYRMVIIDLASICKSIYDRGGFFGALQAQSGAIIRKRAGENAEQDVVLRNINKKFAQEAFQRLFPNCSGDKPRAHDFDLLNKHFVNQSEKVIHLRDSYHAHRYSKDATPGEMNLDELVENFRLVEIILNDIRHVCLGSTFTYNTFEDDPEPLVDIILHRNIALWIDKLGYMDADKKHDGRFYWELRQLYYEKPSLDDDEESD